MPVTFGYSSPRVKWGGGGGGMAESLSQCPVTLSAHKVLAESLALQWLGTEGEGGRGSGGGEGGVDTPSTKTKPEKKEEKIPGSSMIPQKKKDERERDRERENSKTLEGL